MRKRGSKIKKCKICNREFACYMKKHSGGEGIGKRRHNSLTCSKICSRKLAHIHNRFKSNKVKMMFYFQEVNSQVVNKQVLPCFLSNKNRVEEGKL